MLTVRAIVAIVFGSAQPLAAAAQGIEDSVIKTLGRWESAAYLRYVRIPRAQLTGYSCILSSP